MGNLNAIVSRLRSPTVTTGIPVGSTIGPIAISGQSSGFAGPSPWTQYTSSGTLTSHFLCAWSMQPFQAGLTIGWFLEVGSGAAGSEVVRYRQNVAAMSTQGVSWFPIMPCVQWPTNERVAFRVTSSSTNVAWGSGIQLQFTPRPY